MGFGQKTPEEIEERQYWVRLFHAKGMTIPQMTWAFLKSPDLESLLPTPCFKQAYFVIHNDFKMVQKTIQKEILGGSRKTRFARWGSEFITRAQEIYNSAITKADAATDDRAKAQLLEQAAEANKTIARALTVIPEEKTANNVINNFMSIFNSINDNSIIDNSSKDSKTLIIGPSEQQAAKLIGQQSAEVQETMLAQIEKSLGFES